MAFTLSGGPTCVWCHRSRLEIVLWTPCWSGHSSQPAPPIPLGLSFLSTHCVPGTVGGGGGVGPARGSCGPGHHALSCPHCCFLLPGDPPPGLPSSFLDESGLVCPPFPSRGLSPQCSLSTGAAVAEPTQRLSEPCGVAVFGSFAGRGCPRVMACVLSVAQGQRAGLGCVD